VILRACAAAAGLCAIAMPAPSYISPAECASCHSEIAKSYSETGMARSFRALRPGEAAPEFDGRTFSHSPSRQEFSVLRRDGRLVIRRQEIGFNGAVTNVLEKEAHYQFGSGNHAKSYLHRTPGGRLLELPVTWYRANGGSWAMSPAYDRPDHPGFTREISYQCMFCHNAYPGVAAGADWPGNTAVFPATLPEGIDCQRCHGPGSDHAAAARRKDGAEQVQSTIVNPKRLTRARQLETCMQCHLETTSLQLPAALLRPGRGVFSFRPGEPLESYAVHFTGEPDGGTPDGERFDFVSAVTRLRESACFRATEMTCTTCHDPHRIPRGEAGLRQYSAICKSCHGKISSGENHANVRECVSCHMPKRRPDDVVHVQATDHWIRKSRSLRQPEREIHDGNVAPYRGPVRVYYPEAFPATPENSLLLAVAQIKHQANLALGIRDLEAQLTGAQPQAGEHYLELAEALRQAGEPQRALAFYPVAVRQLPARWLPHYGMALALIAAGRPEQAMESLRQASTLAPGEARVPFALGHALMRLGRVQEAIQAFRSGLVLDPERADLLNNLGTALLDTGDAAAAETAFRDAVRIQPELSPTRLNLANALLRRGAAAEGAYHYQHAIATDSAFVAERLRLAAQLTQAGKPAAAAEQRRLSEDRGRQLALAHLNAGLALAALKRIDDAASHWKQAAQGADPEVQKAAVQLLETQRAK